MLIFLNWSWTCLKLDKFLIITDMQKDDIFHEVQR